MRRFDLTRGLDFARYEPGSSPLHRLHPVAKLLGLLSVLAACGAARGSAELSVALLVAVGLTAVTARHALQGALRTLARLAPILLVVSIVEGVVGGVSALPPHGSPQLPAALLDRIAPAAILSILRYSLFVLCLTLFGATTRIGELTYAIEAIGSRLAWTGLPARGIALSITIALSFLPILGAEADRLLKSQAARGAPEPPRGLRLVGRIRALLPLMVPLMVLALRHAENLGRAMEARGYDGRRGRTRLVGYAFGPRDGVAVALSLVAVLLAVVNPFRRLDVLMGIGS